SFARLRVYEQHCAEGALGIEGMDRVGSHNDSRALAPFLIPAADRERSIESDDNLNGMVGMRRHDALCAADQKETAFPQVPARHVKPTVRVVVRLAHHKLLFLAAYFSWSLQDYVQISSLHSPHLWNMPSASCLLYLFPVSLDWWVSTLVSTSP